MTLRIQQLQNGGYYTDVIQVDRSVSGPSTIQSGNVQLLEGYVRQVRFLCSRKAVRVRRKEGGAESITLKVHLDF